MKTLSLRIVAGLLAGLLGGVCAGCAGIAGPRESRAGSSDKTIAQAATTPLSDLNLVRADIPAVLQLAHKAPYALPAAQDCDALAAEVSALDAVLGADLDVSPLASDPGLIERGSSVAGNAATDALRGAAEGVVPFRHWVRKLSGAERYERDVAAAITAGTVRRGFLKGLGQAQGCLAPAAPRR